MYSIKGAIVGVGTRGVLFNRYVAKQREGKLRDEELQAEAELRVYKRADGNLVIPAWNLKKCLLDGARLGGVKHGRRAIGPYLQALIIIDDDPDFGRKDHDGIFEVMGRVPPRTGALVLIRRPKLDPGWRLTFGMRVWDTTLRSSTVRQCFEHSGILAGLGAWRPEWGRFELDQFDVEGE